MTEARKVLSNTAFQVAGKLLTAGISVIIIKIITNYLDISGYGQYSQVYDFLSYFAIISDLGLFTIAVKEMAKDEQKISFVIGNVLSVRILVAFGSLAVAVLTASFIPKYAESKVAIGVMIASIGVFLTILHGTISSVLQIYYKMHVSALSLIGGKLITLGYISYTTYFLYPSNPTQGFAHLILAGVLGAVLMYLITHFYVANLTIFRPRFDFGFWRCVILPSLPYGFALILNNVYLRFNSFFIFFIRGDFEAGLYAVPMKIMEILAVTGLFFMNSVLPGLTKNLKENTEKAREMIQYSFDFLVMASVPIIVGINVLAYPIVYLISNKEYLSRFTESERFYGSDFALKILVVAIFFQFLISLFSFILIAHHHQNQLLWINSIGVTFNIMASYLAVSRFGFIGGAASSVAVEVIVMILMYLTARRKFAFKLSLDRFFKILVSGLTMGIVVYFFEAPLAALFQTKAVLPLIGLGAVVYGGMLFLTRALSLAMLRELFSK